MFFSTDTIRSSTEFCLPKQYHPIVKGEGGIGPSHFIESKFDWFKKEPPLKPIKGRGESLKALDPVDRLEDLESMGMKRN